MGSFTDAELAAIRERSSVKARPLLAVAEALVGALADLDRAVADGNLRETQRRPVRMARHALALAVAALDFALDAQNDPPRRRTRG